MNVYEEKDEQLEEFRYQYRERLDQESEFGLERGKKKRTPLPFFSVAIWSLAATAVSVMLPLIFGLVSPQQMQDLYVNLSSNGKKFKISGTILTTMEIDSVIPSLMAMFSIKTGSW